MAESALVKYRLRRLDADFKPHRSRRMRRIRPPDGRGSESVWAPVRTEVYAQLTVTLRPLKVTGPGPTFSKVLDKMPAGLSRSRSGDTIMHWCPGCRQLRPQLRLPSHYHSDGPTQPTQPRLVPPSGCSFLLMNGDTKTRKEPRLLPAHIPGPCCSYHYY